MEHVTHPRVATRKLPVILILAAQDQTKAVALRALERHQHATIQRVVSPPVTLIAALTLR